MALTTNKFCTAYEQMHIQHASKLMVYAACVYTITTRAHAVLVIELIAVPTTG